ncbi:NAD(P)/FAD-dependent oxidoreductase [Oryzibacter oryziterrae]|uniref:NAD(P)/FAD-dependent oxidoreductase n=1 Tax=Oryzibacter oryziterrae TaxID=2766474 RepID=UPI001F2445FF|nr:FAD-dependent oxidoreductase [Oryzibacter oryziterrae]
MSDLGQMTLAGTRAAVVGAGLAGLTVARKLVRAGAEVTVFEASDAVGGRLGTADPSAVTADRGAQYFTARLPAFKAWVARAKAEGVVTAWAPRGKTSDEEWLVGLPAMGGLLRSMADSFTLKTGSEVVGVTSGEEGCALELADGSVAAGFDRVVVAAPAKTVKRLLGPLGTPFDQAKAAVMRPCWTLTADYGEVDVDFDILRHQGPFTWVARNASRPERSGSHWVAQASTDWSEAHRSVSPDEARNLLVAALGNLLGQTAWPQATQVYFWDDAFTEVPVGTSFLLSSDGRLGCCGDWLIAPRLEAAWMSADSLGDAIIARARSAA